jgi:hypothetical protein
MANGRPRVRIGEAREKLREFEVPTSTTTRRFDEIAGCFELFAQRGFDVEFMEAVSADMVERFIHAKSSNGEPSVSTKQIRRTALRMLFRVARIEFGLGNDPTLAVVLPARSCFSARPLTGEEIALGRSYSLNTLNETRQPAAWALRGDSHNGRASPYRCR